MIYAQKLFSFPVPVPIRTPPFPGSTSRSSPRGNVAQMLCRAPYLPTSVVVLRYDHRFSNRRTRRPPCPDGGRHRHALSADLPALWG